jgi:hypothetical protein
MLPTGFEPAIPAMLSAAELRLRGSAGFEPAIPESGTGIGQYSLMGVNI